MKLAIAIALAACAPRAGTQENQDMTTSKANSVLVGDGDWFEYQVGNPHFGGRTTVRVSGTGSAVVSRDLAGKIERHEGVVPSAQLEALRASLASHPIERYDPPKRHAVPDEATMQFMLVSGGKRTSNSILDNERHEIEALGRLVETIHAIASQVSGGKITY